MEALSLCALAPHSLSALPPSALSRGRAALAVVARRQPLERHAVQA